MASGKIKMIHTDGMEKWYLTDGITENDVIAAYQFIYRPSVEDALVNINDGTKYTLTSNAIYFGYTSGLVMPSQNSYLTNSTLNSYLADGGDSSMSFSAIYGMTRDNENFNACGIHINDRRWFGNSYTMKSGNQAGIFYSINAGWKVVTGTYLSRKSILGVDFTNDSNTAKVYVDGVSYPLANASNQPYRNRWCTFGYQAGDLGNVMLIRVPALVFYRRIISPEQHAAIAKNIADLGRVL